MKVSITLAFIAATSLVGLQAQSQAQAPKAKVGAKAPKFSTQRLLPQKSATPAPAVHPPANHEATLTPGYIMGPGSELLSTDGDTNTVLFYDTEKNGGNLDPRGPFEVLFDASTSWNVGDSVKITGIALSLRAGTSGTLTFEVRQGAGGTGNASVGGLASIGKATAVFPTDGGPDAYYVNFDTPISFVADAHSTSIVIRVSSTGGLEFKAWPPEAYLPTVNTKTGDFASYTVRLSLAGTVTPAP